MTIEYYYHKASAISEPWSLSCVFDGYRLFIRWDLKVYYRQPRAEKIEDGAMIFMTQDDISMSKMLNPEAWRKYERINKRDD